MIYNKTNTITTKDNTCEGCGKLLEACDEHDNIKYVCHKYPAMDNMVRCIDYTTEPIDWMNYFYLNGNKY